jgi:hypothetical protein
MNHFASPDFWICYNRLSPEIQSLADEKYELLKITISIHPCI